MPAPDSTSSATRDRAPALGTPTDVSPPADGATADAPSVPATGSAKAKATDPACPTCRGPLERYAGAAAHKLGSFWCHVDGRRWHPHELGATPDEATAPGSTSGTKAAG